ncbi:MAG: hypothetical protein QOG67_3031 [Verrucomicrobiota bacterium]
MRVLHIGKFLPPHWGGIETHVQVLGENLTRFVDVNLLVANDNRFTETCSDGAMLVTRAGTLLNFASTPVCPSMVSAVQKANADLIHLHLPNPAAIFVYLLSGFKGPLVVTYHSDTVRHEFLARAFRPFLLQTLNRSAAIIVSSKSNIENSPILTGFKERCRVIPFGISSGEFDHCDAGKVEAIRREYGGPIVLAVGRHVHYKGLQYLIRAMKRIPARLLLVGEGPLSKQLKKETDSCGLAGRVTFLGAVDDVAPYYHAADVFVLPSINRAEAFGIVQLEAMACGKPVVNTQITTAVPTISLSGVTGLTVPPAHAEALAAAINLLLDKPDLRRRYGQAARRRFEQEFSVEVMTDSVLKVYSEALGWPLAANGARRAQSA